MSTAVTSNVLFATTLLDAELSVPGGVEVVSTPAMAVGEVLVYPRPRVCHDERGRACSVVLDLRCWLISLPGSRSVPMECDGPHAVLQAADVLDRDLARGALAVDSPAALADWVARWCAHRADATPIPLPLEGLR